MNVNPVLLFEHRIHIHGLLPPGRYGAVCGVSANETGWSMSTQQAGQPRNVGEREARQVAEEARETGWQ